MGPAPDWSTSRLSVPSAWSRQVVSAMSQSEELTRLLETVRSHIRAGSGRSALEFAEIAVTEHAGEAEAHEIRATVLFLMERYDQAIESYEAALACNPRRGPSLINLGAVYNRQKQFDKAVQVLRKAVQVDKRSAEAFYNLGYAHRHLKQFALAVPAYREAIRLNPRMADAHQNLGNVYLEMRNYHQAIACYTKALQISPDHSRALRGLQRAHEERDAISAEASPFGRLVDERTLAAAQESSQRSFRQLSVEDRFCDRQVLSQSAAMIEREVKGLQQLLADELRPILKRLDRALSASAGPGELMNLRKELDAGRAGIAISTRKLGRLDESLAQHEKWHVVEQD